MPYRSLRVAPVFNAMLIFAVAVFAPMRLPAADLSEATSNLLTAIMADNTAQVRSAIDTGADVNADSGEGRTPLIVAAMSTRPDAVRVLLERGADPRRRADDTAIGNAVTAAFFAMNGTELTGRSDDPDPRKHVAALEVLKLIASRKSDLNLLVRRAQTDMTALMIAAQAGALDAVEILLAAGADSNATNGGKHTALDYARERAPVWSPFPAADREAIVRALVAAGARPSTSSGARKAVQSRPRPDPGS
jgi:ankyrin repeat protein